MNKQEQRIAIAEACGWHGPDSEETKAIAGTWTKPEIWMVNPSGHIGFISDCPDYLNDLNAMQEAICSSELHTSNQLAFQYISNLCEAIGIPEDRLCMALIHAPAAQRAEAFLKTLNLWDQSEG